MTFKDYFSTDSAAYRAYRPSYDSALVQRLACDLPGQDLAIDVGCGNGQFSVRLAEHFDQVIAFDGSADQIKEAEPRPNIDYRVATAEALDAAPGSADLVCAMQAAHWFDLPAFYWAADRVLKPGGRLALVGYGLLTIDPDIDAVITEFYRHTVGAYWPADRVLIDGRYASLPFPYEEERDPEHMLTADWPLEHLVRYIGTWSAVVRATRQLGRNPLEELVPKLQEVWGDTAARPVRWPLFMRLGRKPMA